MTSFIGATNTGGMLGNLAPQLRTDMRACQASFSERWWAFGLDMLWPRSRFIMADNSFGNFFWDLNGASDIWDWDWLLAGEGKVGQRRDNVSGITRDSTGAALGGVTVKAFDLARDLIVDTTVSDANGNFAVTTPYTGQTIYCVAYKAGTPVYGATAQLTPS